MRLLKKEKTYKEIVYYILSENLQVGDRIPTENDFCKRCGVSRVTLRTAIDALVKEGIVKRCGRNGTILTAIPKRENNLSFNAAQKRILFIYFARPKQAASFLDDAGATPEQLYVGIEKGVNERNDVIMVQAGVNFIKANNSLLDTVDGIIMGGEVPEAATEKIIDRGVPFVSVDTPHFPAVCDSVCLDYYEAGELACKRIVSSEQGNILFLGAIYEGSDRLQPAYREIFSGVQEYVYNRDGLNLFKHSVLLENDKDKEVEALVSYINENNVNYIVACSGMLEEYLLAAMKQCNDEVALCVISPSDSNSKLDAVRVSLNSKKLGYIATGRLYERFANPELQVVRVLVPVDDSIH